MCVCACPHRAYRLLRAPLMDSTLLIATNSTFYLRDKATQWTLEHFFFLFHIYIRSISLVECKYNVSSCCTHNFICFLLLLYCFEKISTADIISMMCDKAITAVPDPTTVRTWLGSHQNVMCGC